MFVNDVEFNLVQWNKMGDHPLVTSEHSQEVPYPDLAEEGCGFINQFQVVHPSDFLLEINGHVVSILSKEKVSEIFKVAL